jgi:Uma2 family endonuclease
MATTTAGISLEQFLAMPHDGPEPDFVDGEVVERSMPDWVHSGIQAELCVIFRRTASLVVRPELRVWPEVNKSYIIDVCAYPSGQQMPRFPTTPPIVAVEILSKDDRYTEINAKLDAYFKWGVAHIWLIDPWFPQLSVYDSQGLRRVSALDVPEFAIHITLEQLMAGI